jgi:hypothetical protein
MKITEEQIRKFVRNELFEAKKQAIRQVVKEELMKEDSDKTLVKSMKISAQEMANQGQAFIIKGFKEDEVEIVPVDNYVVYRAHVTTKIIGDVSDDTTMKVAQAIVPKFYPTGIEKNEKVIETLKAKGKTYNMGDIIQTVKIQLPDILEVKYI